MNGRDTLVLISAGAQATYSVGLFLPKKGILSLKLLKFCESFASMRDFKDKNAFFLVEKALTEYVACAPALVSTRVSRPFM